MNTLNVYYDENLNVARMTGRNLPSNQFKLISSNNGRFMIKNEENNAFFSITDWNFMYLLQHGGMNGTMFSMECVIVKINGKFILVPTNSEDYQKIMENTERGKPTLRKYNSFTFQSSYPSDQNSMTGYYLGKYKRDLFLCRKVNHSSTIYVEHGDNYSYYGKHVYLFFTGDKIVQFFSRNDFVLISKQNDKLSPTETAIVLEQYLIDSAKNTCSDLKARDSFVFHIPYGFQNTDISIPDQIKKIIKKTFGKKIVS